MNRSKSMTKIRRRTFVGQSAKAGLGLAAGLTILRNAASVRGAPANEKLVLCLVGVGRGTVLGTGFGSRDDCRLAYIADVNRQRLEAQSKPIMATPGGAGARLLQDFRKALDDKSVDASGAGESIITMRSRWSCATECSLSNCWRVETTAMRQPASRICSAICSPVRVG